jgi:hypothetical protein
MTEFLNALREIATNKAASLSAAAVAPVAAFAPTTQKFIDLSSTGYGPLSWAGWIALTSFLYVFTCLIEKYGAFRLAKWLWELLMRKLRNKSGE